MSSYIYLPLLKYFYRVFKYLANSISLSQIGTESNDVGGASCVQYIGKMMTKA